MISFLHKKKIKEFRKRMGRTIKMAQGFHISKTPLSALKMLPKVNSLMPKLGSGLCLRASLLMRRKIMP